MNSVLRQNVIVISIERVVEQGRALVQNMLSDAILAGSTIDNFKPLAKEQKAARVRLRSSISDLLA